MGQDRFWLTDEQFARIAPHLPRDTRGKPRVDDQRVISGIVHVSQVWRPLDRRAGGLRSRARHSTIGMSVGQAKAFGSSFSEHWQAPAGHPSRC